MRAAEGAFNEGRIDQADRGFVLGALEQGFCGLQGTGLRPAAHLRKDRSPGREVMRQAAPATPIAQEIKDGIEPFSCRHPTWAPVKSVGYDLRMRSTL